MSRDLHPDDALSALASRLIDAPEAAPSDSPTPWPAGIDLRSLGWTLKASCYADWHGNPPRAARAALALARLAGQAEAAPPHPAAAELRGLAHWTAGIAALTRGQLGDAVAALDAAAQALNGAACADAAAQTQVPKIMALSLLGRRAEAAACGELALAALREVGNWPVAARVGLNLGNLQLMRAAYPEAARHFREAAVRFARLGDRTHSVLADIGLAEALAAQGDFDEAQRIVARASMRADHPGLGLQQALADESAALLALVRGRYHAALAGLESARRRYAALGVPQYLAIGEKQLADAYLELRLLPEAWRLFDAAVGRFAELSLPDEQAAALAQRGRAEVLLGQPAAADASLAKAAALYSELGQGVGAANVALARAELALHRADAPSPSVALAWADQAAAGHADAGQVDGQARAAVLRQLALLQLGQPAQAAAGFASLLADARVRGQGAIEVRCLTGQGLAALAQGNASEATMAFDAAIELAEDQHRALPGDEIRTAFLTDQLRPYQERLRLALADGEPAEVMRQLDRLRARSLDEAPERAPATASDGADRTVLRERLNWLYRRVQRQQDDGEPDEACQRELRQIEHELLERTRRQRLLRQPASSPTADAGLAIAQLQAALQSGDALVAYGVLDDELFACVLKPCGLALVRQLADWSQLQSVLQGVRFQLDTLRHGAVPVQRHLDTLQRRLAQRLAQAHAAVWAPLLPALGAVRRVLVLPHGELGGLPFAALAPLGGTPLAEQHALAVAPSARSALRSLQRASRPLQRALALGISAQLPQAGVEALRVAAHYAQGQALIDSAATPAALRLAVEQGADGTSPGVDLLHLACHGQFRGDNPRFSALHLHDGALTVDEAEALPLAAQGPLVVLSACETALSDAGPVEAQVGLVRAFLRAGATRVLASLWPVDDAVTATFMDRFHGALAAGQPAATALRVAQAAVRAGHPHPFYWAPFTLYGGW